MQLLARSSSACAGAFGATFGMLALAVMCSYASDLSLAGRLYGVAKWERAASLGCPVDGVQIVGEWGSGVGSGLCYVWAMHFLSLQILSDRVPINGVPNCLWQLQKLQTNHVSQTWHHAQ